MEKRQLDKTIRPLAEEMLMGYSDQEDGSIWKFLTNSILIEGLFTNNLDRPFPDSYHYGIYINQKGRLFGYNGCDIIEISEIRNGQARYYPLNGLRLSLTKVKQFFDDFNTEHIELSELSL